MWIRSRKIDQRLRTCSWKFFWNNRLTLGPSVYARAIFLTNFNLSSTITTTVPRLNKPCYLFNARTGKILQLWYIFTILWASFLIYRCSLETFISTRPCLDKRPMCKVWVDANTLTWGWTFFASSKLRIVDHLPRKSGFQPWLFQACWPSTNLQHGKIGIL